MSDFKNNDNNLNINSSKLTISGNNEILIKLSPKILETYKQLALKRGILSYELNAQPVSGVGENSYGFILQMCLTSIKNEQQETENAMPMTLVNILKISPKNPAFRAHGRIVDLYKREVFIYQQVFKEFYNVQQERLSELKNTNHNHNHCDNIITIPCAFDFDIVPEILYASLDLENEFIILEDLTLSGYKQNSRTNMPTYDLVCQTFRSIAKFHAMSFILQHRKPETLKMLVRQMNDNLFTPDMEPLNVEFGKKYIQRTRLMMEQDMKSPSRKHIEALKKLENNFKDICLKCVDGKAVAPYAVICHGDFWNNNILYKYDVGKN